MICNAVKGHKSDEITTMLSQNNLVSVLIPNNCTDKLQPIDISVNKLVKDHLRKKLRIGT